MCSLNTVLLQLTGLRIAPEKVEKRERNGDETWSTVSLNSSAHTTPGSYKKGKSWIDWQVRDETPD